MNHTGVQSTGCRRHAASIRSAGAMAGCFLSWLLTWTATLLRSRPAAALPALSATGGAGSKGMRRPGGQPLGRPVSACRDPDAAMARPCVRALRVQLGAADGRQHGRHQSLVHRAGQLAVSGGQLVERAVAEPDAAVLADRLVAELLEGGLGKGERARVAGAHALAEVGA